MSSKRRNNVRWQVSQLDRRRENKSVPICSCSVLSSRITSKRINFPYWQKCGYWNKITERKWSRLCRAKIMFARTGSSRFFYVLLITRYFENVNNVCSKFNQKKSISPKKIHFRFFKTFHFCSNVWRSYGHFLVFKQLN